MKLKSRFLAALLGILAIGSAHADDAEVFNGSFANPSGVRPNVLFIMDTSGSMDTEVKAFYEDGTKYAGDCDPNRVYWRTEDTSQPPDCLTTTQWISADNNRCRAAALAFDDAGWWRGRLQMLNKSASPSKWSDPTAGQDWKVECYADHPKFTSTPHGDLPGTSAPGSENKYPRNGSESADSFRWGASDKSSSLMDMSAVNRFSLYSGNYANWYKSTDGGKTSTRLKIVQKVAKQIINSMSGVNMGLMRYSADADGGMVVYPVSELTPTSRDDMNKIIDGFIGEGNTPLSETMYEAYRYLSGQDWYFGKDSQVVDYYITDRFGRQFPVLKTQTSDSRAMSSGSKYDSPMDFTCQKTFIVYLTDGLPTTDTAANKLISDAPPGGLGQTCAGTDDGDCMVALTKYMHDNDLVSTVKGSRVTTYMIGFGSDIKSSEGYLKDIAAAGGGTAYTQTDAAGLAGTLEEIFSSVVEQAGTTFVAPAVSVNAFNRSQNLNELYISVFKPAKNIHWPGNLKKYRIYNGAMYGVGASKVVGDDGFFLDGSQAMNSPGVKDGADAAKGGTASTLPDSGSRKLYTYLSSQAKTDLTDGVNAITVSNDKITAAMMSALDDVDRQRVIDYARGLDLYDEDKSSPTHHKMGDPMHARPAILIHGGTEAAPIGTVFVPTNDGLLHAFDMASMGDPADPASVPAKSMDERWAFVPEEYLPQLKKMYDNPVRTNRSYALDGDVKVFKYDVNQNGIIDSGDKAYLFFGTGRGGSNIYSLDVTEVDKPTFRWKIDPTVTGFGKLGKTWSVPQIARVQIGDGTGQSTQKFVLIFGGGYDTSNDNDPATFTYQAEDSAGTELYMVDLETGKLLWRAGKSGTGLNFTNANMTHSFPANLTVLDTDGDLFADRIYAADMGGQVWRFDIWNKKSADELVTGGVFASLGNKALGTPTRADNRKFYYAPDVAPITSRGSHPFMNIAIGSGYRGHPLNTYTQDRFYSLRDYFPFTKRDQASYNSTAAITEADKSLVDVTTDITKAVGDDKNGWMIQLNNPSWRGEKVLAESITAGGVIFFTTFTPLAASGADPCLSRALNRVWGVNAVDGDPFTRWTDSSTKDLTANDRFMDTKQAGIAPAVAILSNPDSTDGMAICQYGAQILNRCVKVGEAVRSYWETKK